MHRLQSRTYVGEPGETVTVNTTVHGGGQISVTVGGQPLSGDRFQLPSTPGAGARMQIALTGPQGASCVVSIAVVDTASDADFLMCSVFNPAPVNFYDFSVARQATVAAFGAAKGVPAAGALGAAVVPGTRPTGKAPSKRKPARRK